MPGTDTTEIPPRGLRILTRVLYSNPLWVPVGDESGPELTDTQQAIVDELHRLAGLHDGKSAVMLAVDVLRHNGHTAALDVFLADDHQDALDEDHDRWDFYWTGGDEVEQFGIDHPIRTEEN